MIVIKKNNKNIISDLTFEKPLDYYTSASSFWKVDHDKILKDVASKCSSFASVIISIQNLNDSLWDDPTHMHKTNYLLVSEVREEARRRMQNHYYNDEELKCIFSEFELPDWNVNYGEKKEEEDRKFKIEIEDAIFEAQEFQLFHDIVNEFKEGCHWKYDEEKDKEIKLSKKDFLKKWEKEKLRIFMPRVRTEYKRVYHMPKPFSHWDHRNLFQQWYFFEGVGKIYYAQGGSGSSGQREHQGRFAHVFATLEKIYKKKLPTYCLSYNSRNQLCFIRKYNSFKAVNRELSGNYPADHSKLHELFKGRLVKIDYKTARITEADTKDAY
jgi:hypothetical protein